MGLEGKVTLTISYVSLFFLISSGYMTPHSHLKAIQDSYDGKHFTYYTPPLKSIVTDAVLRSKSSPFSVVVIYYPWCGLSRNLMEKMRLVENQFTRTDFYALNVRETKPWDFLSVGVILLIQRVYLVQLIHHQTQELKHAAIPKAFFVYRYEFNGTLQFAAIEYNEGFSSIGRIKSFLKRMESPYRRIRGSEVGQSIDSRVVSIVASLVSSNDDDSKLLVEIVSRSIWEAKFYITTSSQGEPSRFQMKSYSEICGKRTYTGLWEAREVVDWIKGVVLECSHFAYSLTVEGTNPNFYEGIIGYGEQRVSVTPPGLVLIQRTNPPKLNRLNLTDFSVESIVEYAEKTLNKESRRISEEMNNSKALFYVTRSCGFCYDVYRIVDSISHDEKYNELRRKYLIELVDLSNPLERDGANHLTKVPSLILECSNGSRQSYRGKFSLIGVVKFLRKSCSK